MTRGLAAIALVACAPALGACGALLGLHEKALEADADGGDAGPAADAGAAADGAAGDAPGAAGCAFDAEGYGDVGAAGCWSTVDITTVAAPGAHLSTILGIAFDGRYMYFAPAVTSSILRFDTRGALADPAAWSTFDVQAKLGILPNFKGAVFDGRYVTFVPEQQSPLVVRCDTSAPFDAASSWDTFDPTGLDPKANGFAGAVFDGSYVYFVPGLSTVVARHDVGAAANAGWEKFDVAAFEPVVLKGFFGAVFDGKGITFVPESGGVAVRYDTSAPFTAAASYKSFDTQALAPNASTPQYVGGAFDGRFVYLVPSASDTLATRFDPSGAFGAAASWSTFDLGTMQAFNGLFQTGAFDGRFLYFAPAGITNGSPDTLVARYDTTKPFASAASWRAADARSGPFGSTAFDGRFVYFAPSNGSPILARFAARATPRPPAPPGFPASFF